MSSGERPYSTAAVRDFRFVARNSVGEARYSQKMQRWLAERTTHRKERPFRPYEVIGGIDSRAEGPWLGELLARWAVGPKTMAEQTENYIMRFL